MSSLRARSAVVAGLAVLPVLSAAPALAAAPERETFALVCGGTTYTVVVNGQGEFTPARDIASTKVFVPHVFGPFTGVLRDASGAVVEQFTDPGATQGSGKQPRDITCTFTFTFTSTGGPDEPPAGYTFTGTGTVSGQVSGRR